MVKIEKVEGIFRNLDHLGDFDRFQAMILDHLRAAKAFVAPEGEGRADE
jgi:hypothetical protein